MRKQGKVEKALYVSREEVLSKALEMLEKHPLCDHCLGRQFAMLGHGTENAGRGAAIKLVLTLNAHATALTGKKKGAKILKILASNGFSENAKEILKKTIKKTVKEQPKICYLCENSFNKIRELVNDAFEKLSAYEYHTFVVGVELPVEIEEREDEFKAEFKIRYGENIRNEFGRIIGKALSELSKKPVNYETPDLVVLVNPFTKHVRLQINPLYIMGRYRKLVRGIPQSEWICTQCQGKGCPKCSGTGKMYQESVEELIATPTLEATQGLKASFHASGREDIDARMLGTGRPFVVEISKPKKRFLDLDVLKKAINKYAKGKVEVLNLNFADKNVVRRLKKAEASRKLYRIVVEFDNEISEEKLLQLEKKLSRVMIRQKTPKRVLHRRANLTREKYIYEVKVRKLTPTKVEMRILCQGGLYIKELVTGDEGRTIPNVSQILNTKAKPLELDVLEVMLKEE